MCTFVWESTSDGLLFTTIDVACKSCQKKKKKRILWNRQILRIKKEVFQFSKNPFFPTIRNVKPNLATKINELDGFSISAVPVLSLALL